MDFLFSFLPGGHKYVDVHIPDQMDIAEKIQVEKPLKEDNTPSGGVMSMKIIFDTDIGSDIDDAFCLAYLLMQEKCEIMGITTVTGEPIKRAMLASALCMAAKRKIPIYPGEEKPISGILKQKTAPQAQRISRWNHIENFPEGRATHFLRDTIRENPGEIILLATGPLTNVAKLFIEDGQAAGLLKGLVMMCGDFSKQDPTGEWNASGDPRATSIVYGTSIRMHRSLGLNVTRKVRMSQNRIKDRFTAPVMGPVLDFAEVWFSENDSVTFHDPLAAASIFDEAICDFERGTVNVHEEEGKVFTVWRPDPLGEHDIAVKVDRREFFDHLGDILKGV